MNATINGQSIAFAPGETVLAAARRTGHFIPSLCTFAPLNHTPGTCRVCLADCSFPDGGRGMVPACATPLEDGMVVCTNSPEVLARQRLQVELLFAEHDLACDTCPRHGKCELQEAALHVGLGETRFRLPAAARPRGKDESALALVMDPAKCVHCLRCAAACRRQGLNALAPEGEGLATRMGFVGADRWGESPRCVQCGQCGLVCPVGAISDKSDPRVSEWLADPELTTFVFFSSAVSAAIGKALSPHLPGNDAGRLTAALRLLGADVVGNGDYGAELACKAEAEAVVRRKARNDRLPVFSSRCPAWLGYVEKHRPDLLPHLSGAPFPAAALGRLAKEQLSRTLGLAPERLRVIAITTCTALKAETLRQERSREGTADIDAAITVRECADLLRARGLRLDEMSPEAFDPPYAGSPEAPAGFNGHGDVAQAAAKILGKAIRANGHTGFAGLAPLLDGWLREAEACDFIEIMACPEARPCGRGGEGRENEKDKECGSPGAD